ncbi:MAG: hypothetical protein QGH62_02265, partial [Nitrospinaceae bacterium]|nr:hypothetical protein [Nitrospinaceae bacterium]
LHDKANASLLISKTIAAEAVKTIVPRIASDVACDHIRLACFTLVCPDKSIAFLNNVGVLPRSIRPLEELLH